VAQAAVAAMQTPQAALELLGKDLAVEMAAG
jgi:hypothetical protein